VVGEHEHGAGQVLHVGETSGQNPVSQPENQPDQTPEDSIDQTHNSSFLLWRRLTMLATAAARPRYNTPMEILSGTAFPGSADRSLAAMLGRIGLVAAVVGGLLQNSGPALGCPFCSAVSLTFAQEIAQSEAAVVARLIEPPPASALGPTAEGPLPKGKFEVVEVLKGGDLVAAAGHVGAAGEPVETILLEDKPIGTLFLLMGVESPTLVWSSPVRVSDRAVAYLRKIQNLPEQGPERLAFFLDHLEDEDDSLARDAYDEFAVAPYADVRNLKDRLDPKQLLGWIEDPAVQANRRRLYATLLGVCGTDAEAERIAAILSGQGAAADHAEVRGGLDALIACHVALRGPAALDLVDELFLDRSRGGKEAPFTETYAAVMALRFLGEESDLVPRERVLASLRLLLDEPKLADLVIADLARWQDWSVIDRLVTIFKEAKSDNIFVREPVVNYLRACPLPEAAAAVEELNGIDPEAVRRAATLAGLAGISAAAPADDLATSPELAPIDAALASQIGPVYGDEDPTAVTLGHNLAASVPPAAPDPTAATNASSGWKWGLWAAVVLIVAVLARAALKPGSSGG